MANLGGASATVIAGSPVRQGNASADAVVMKALGELWSRGVDIAWDKVYAHRQCRRVELPTYPFERKRCWVEPVVQATVRDEPAMVQTAHAAAMSASAGDPAATPRNESETLVAGIWEELLGVQGIGIHDNFFVLGGQSLLATRVMTRIGEVSGIELPVDTIFEQPTIAGVARALFEQRVALENPDLIEQLLAEL
jgi:phthiocerol/phenolphthiocerol synthesis type-I polyketide synthase E